MVWVCANLWWLLFAACGGAIGYSVAVVWRVRRGLRAAAPVDGLKDRAAPEGGWPSVCVVVPAHNEEGVIGRLAGSLLAQEYPALRVVFALDRCTDGTRGEIERVCGGDARVEIVEIDECPDDWAGKTHAAHRGVADSVAAGSAECLLFTDADTWFASYCVRAAVSAVRERGVGMVSLLSTLEARSVWELALQPAAVMALMRQHPLDRVNSPRSRRAFANGQFMLFEAGAYRAIGGHGGVRDKLLEDLAFAYALKHGGGSWAVLPAGGALRCRMYDSRGAFLEGWRRIYMESARRMPGRLRWWGAEFLVTGTLVPLGALASVVVGGWCAFARGDGMSWVLFACGIAAVVCWFVATARVWRAQGAAWWSAVLAPYGAAVVAGVMFGAAGDLARRRVVRWGGREYTLEPRAKG